MVSTIANFELATRYLHDWALATINQSGSYGISSANLADGMATRAYFESAIAAQDPIFVWMNGHGNENKLGGQNNEIILDTNNNGILSGRVCYAFSCLTAIELGPSTVEKGGLSYIGYSADFVFLYDTQAASPLSDKSARWFMVPGVQIGLSLFQGKTTGEAYADSQSVFMMGMDYWENSTDVLAPQMLACLYQDKGFQSLIGSTTATITPDKRYSPPRMPTESPIQAGLSSLITLSLIGTSLYYLMKGRLKL